MAVKGNKISLLLSGAPYLLEDCNIVITQPSVRQIAAVGETEFLSAVQFFGRTDEVLKKLIMGNSQLEGYSNFQILMGVLSQDEGMRDNVEKFFQLVFPDYIIEITDAAIQFRIKLEDGNESGIKGMINSFNYDSFSEIVDDMFLMPKSKEDIEYDPANKKASEIAEKLKRGREKAKMIKQKSNGDLNDSLFGSYISILSVALPMDINTLYSYTPFQLYNSFSRYWAKNKSDFYQKIATTPMMSVEGMDKPDD